MGWSRGTNVLQHRALGCHILDDVKAIENLISEHAQMSPTLICEDEMQEQVMNLDAPQLYFEAWLTVTCL